MEHQINQAIETAKEYGTAAYAKASELANEAVTAAKEVIGDLQGSAESHGITRKQSTGPLSPAEEKKLDDALASRPTPKELQEKNILKDVKVAPALQAKQDELKAQQLKDSLEGKIAHRPAPEELTQKNILKDDPVSGKDGQIQAGVAALEKSQAASNIEAGLASRPPPEELIKEGILNKDENPKTS